MSAVTWICKNCRFYEPVKHKRHGYCRKPYAHYENLKVNASHIGATRCFERKELTGDETERTD